MDKEFVYCPNCGNVYQVNEDGKLTFWDVVENVPDDIFEDMDEQPCGCTD